MLAQIKSLSIAWKIVGCTVFVLAAVLTVNYVVFTNNHRASSLEQMIDRAEAFTAAADEAKNHVSKIGDAGVLDQDAIAADLKATLAAGKPYTEAKIFNTIPVVAGWSSA